MGKYTKKQRNHNNKQNQTQSEKHYFKLKRIQHMNLDLYYTKNIICDFSPFTTSGGTVQSSLPIYNLDRKYWTKSFIPALRKQYYLSNPSKEKQKFAQKYRKKTYHEIQSSHTSFQHQARPLPKSDYCYICSKSIQNYYSHIQNKSHRKIERSTNAHKFIFQLVYKYQQINRTPEKQTKQIMEDKQIERGERTSIKSNKRKYRQ